MTAATRTMLRKRALRDGGRQRVMVTPEGVALPLTIASRGTRAGALMLDLLFIGLLMIATTTALIFIAGGAIGSGLSVNAKGPLGEVLEFLVVIWIAAMFLFRNAYFLFFELGPRGATPGKRIAGIRIASRDGGRLSAEMVIARNLLRDIELFLPLVFLASAGDAGGDMDAAGIAATLWFMIFALFPLFNKDRMRAGDLIAGSWVVETPRRKLEAVLSVAPAAQAPAGPAPSPAYHFGEAELSVYGEYELQMLERVLRDDRAEAMQAVYEAICTKIGWRAGQGDARPFLEAYYRALRQRLEAGMRMGQRKADKFG
jgi:uncharacterized RDD family membrane protein YckC